MQINDPTVLQNRDKFRIVDASGNEVEGSEFWGYNDEKKLLIFEGHWGSLGACTSTASAIASRCSTRSPCPRSRRHRPMSRRVRCAGLCAADLRAADRRGTVPNVYVPPTTRMYVRRNDSLLMTGPMYRARAACMWSTAATIVVHDHVVYDDNHVV